MRLVAADTETTGLHSKDGDRIIEIALVEVSRDPNAPYYHTLVDPVQADGERRKVSPEAFNVHGISDAMLVGKPTFAQCLPGIVEFLDGSPLIFHNAGFDMEFIRDECMEAGFVWEEVPIIDTLRLAQEEFPNSRQSLDALCNRFGIDLSVRTKHSALVDTRLLAQLYLAWKGQDSLNLTAVKMKKAVIATEALGKLNDIRVPMPNGLPEKPVSTSWAAHFDGITL
jgi:DNA polymerase-3 subunit epsilon